MISVAALTINVSDPDQNIYKPKAHLPGAIKTKNMDQETISMKVVNPHAAGIDVGQQEQNIKEFGVYNQDLYAVADWLSEHRIKTVAMQC